MNDSFSIPVAFNDSELLFPGQLLQQGYTYKILVEVDGLKINFEPDEEGKFRAIIDDVLIERAHQVNVPLLKAIADGIALVVR